jgi:hypothetical protein
MLTIRSTRREDTLILFRPDLKMDENEVLKVWVKYVTQDGAADVDPVQVSVPPGSNVNDLKEIIKRKLELTERLHEINLHGPDREREEGGAPRPDEGETRYRPGRLVSDITRHGFGLADENPILIRTIALQGIYKYIQTICIV